MGLFKKIKKAVKNPVKAVTSVAKVVVNNPIRATTAVASLGLSEVARSAPIIGSTVKELQAVGSETYLALANSFTGGLSGTLQQTAAAVLEPPEEPDMGINLGQLIGGLGGAATNLGNFSSNPYLQTVGTISTAFGGAYNTQPMSSNNQMIPTSGTAQVYTVANSGVPARLGRSTLTQEVADAGGKILQRLGLTYSNSVGSFTSVLKRALTSVASLARRTPAGTMVNLLIGLGLTAGEAYLLTTWQAQRKKSRRMNPANGKALRRAARRIKGFHKLCVHTDVLKTRSRGVSRGRSCGTCRKSPCRC